MKKKSKLKTKAKRKARENALHRVVELNTQNGLIEPNKNNDLSRVKANWFYGEWERLAELSVSDLSGHPDSAVLAVLVSSAHQQLGRHKLAKKFARIALEWGCEKQLLAMILIASVHNTLGRSFALVNNEEKTLEHFTNSIKIGPIATDDISLLRHQRSVKEVSRLGLIPQVATLLERELNSAQSNNENSELSEAMLNVLKVEMELLSGMISQSLQRQQIHHSQGTKDLISTEIEDDNGNLFNKSVSQLGQDIWVLEKTDYKTNGFFVEFGATDGVLLSNTFLLESEYGWNGLCAEPNPKFFERLKNNRICQVSDDCIAGETGMEVDFVLAAEFGTMSKYIESDTHKDKRAHYVSVGDVIKKNTISLEDFLIKYKAPKNIDYLSIDTEGSEYEILSSFPFSKWEIKLITVEHNHTHQRELIRELLVNLKYKYKQVEWDDWYYLE